MARANRHFIPGHVWHMTHRCHKREFLLKFSKDRNRWIELLFEVKKCHQLSILNLGLVLSSSKVHPVLLCWAVSIVPGLNGFCYKVGEKVLKFPVKTEEFFGMKVFCLAND